LHDLCSTPLVLEIMGHVGELGTSSASCVEAQWWHRVAHAQGHTRVEVDGVALPWWWESDGEGKNSLFYVVVSMHIQLGYF
jgi:hypothetical protein